MPTIVFQRNVFQNNVFQPATAGVPPYDIAGISSDASISSVQTISGNLFEDLPMPIPIPPPAEVGELRFGRKAYVPIGW